MAIPQSTAYTVLVKAFLSSDHVTPATGKTLAVTLCKAGAAFGNPSAGAANATEVSNGWYSYALSTTDAGTVGDLVVRLTGAGVDDAERVIQVVNANTGGLAALPNTACTTNASLITSGTGTDQVSVSAGKVLLQATQAGVTIPTVTAVTGQLTAAQVATGVWQDATAGDFTAASSVGKSLYTAGNAPGAASGLALVGSNVGSASSVTGAVGSVTGAVTVGANNDKTGYSLTQSFPANFSALAVTAGGAVTAGTVTDKSGYSLTQAFPANFAALGISVGGHVSNVDTLTTYTGDTPQTGDTYARLGVAGAGLTALGDARLAHLDTDVSSRSTYAGADTGGTTTLLARVPGTVQPQTGDSYARLGLPAGASVSADVAAVKGDTTAVKAKTDSLTYTTPGVVDAGVRYVNGVQVRGTGTTLDPWGPA